MNRNFILFILLFTAVGALVFNFWMSQANEATSVGMIADDADNDPTKFGIEMVKKKKFLVEISADRLTSLETSVLGLKTEINAIKTALKRAESINDLQTSSIVSSASLDDVQEPSAEDLAAFRDYENEQKKRSEERFNQQITEVEDRFLAEPADPKWSYLTSGAIHEALSTLPDDALNGADFRDVECRATMCRMIVEYNDPMAQDAFETQLPMVIGDILPQLTATHEDVDGILRGIYFFEIEETDPV